MKKTSCFLPKIVMKANGIQYGKGLKLYGCPFIFRFSKASIEIGNDVVINSNFLSNLLGLYQRTIIIAKNQGKVKIGNRVGISGATVYAWNSIEIGDNTRIGANVKIVDTDFHPVDPTERLNGNNAAAGCKPIKIGKNVFIGMNSIILKGTIIGDNSVVGAGAVVHGVFPDNCVIAGNPARIVKYLDGKESYV